MGAADRGGGWLKPPGGGTDISLQPALTADEREETVVAAMPSGSRPLQDGALDHAFGVMRPVGLDEMQDLALLHAPTRSPSAR